MKLEVKETKLEEQVKQSGEIEEEDVDITKVKIAWAHIDKMLQTRFFENQDVVYYYSKMQVLNFLRILKYTQDKKMDSFVKNCMIDAMEET